MTDIAHTLVAKSDQLNAADIIGTEKLLTITKVDVKSGDQPVTIHYEGENGRPWKPALTARRILSALWGTESDKWVGHTVAVHNDLTVVYAGEEVGGVRPHAATGIETTQIIKLKEKRGPKPKTFTIQPLRLDKSGPKTKAVEYTFEGYAKFIRSVIAMDDPEAMKARFEKAQDWRLKAVEENRDEATKLREEYEARLEDLSSGSDRDPE